jgi:hypothetical protein
MTHELIDNWVSGYAAANYGEVGRSSVLGLIGETQSAKTWKAMSLWPEETLKLSCNALPHGILPSLKEFDRTAIWLKLSRGLLPRAITGAEASYRRFLWLVCSWAHLLLRYCSLLKSALRLGFGSN